MWILQLEPRIAVPVWLAFTLVLAGALFLLEQVESDTDDKTDRRILKFGRRLIAAVATVETMLMLLSVAIHGI